VTSYIVLAIPVFFLLIGIEVLAARLLERDYYRLNDSIADLSCGILQQLFEVFAKGLIFGGYVWVYESHRFATLPSGSALVWVAGFLGVDFLYYWFHRTSHEVSAVWATHVVHHQSEEYNLAVALRQGSFQSSMSWVFYLPLALAGLPPLVFLTLSSINTLYQFWIHTRLIGRLGPLEAVFNTPSHHRVHHGRDPKYIDRNHGGTLIVWDRLFGTFQAEEEEPVYGITRPLASWNPVWANFHVWAELLELARRARRWRDRLRVFVARPGWRPDDLGGYQGPREVDRAAHRKWDVPVTPGLKAYTFVHFVPVLGAAAALLFLQADLSRPLLTAGAAWCALSLVSLAALHERRARAFALEAARLALACAALPLLPPLPAALLPPIVLASLGLAAASLAWLQRVSGLRSGAPAFPAAP
jgi:sterol desaturase/sphingolipid hydroxylase (fatty acid hydroxylase superfamily)